MRRRSRRALHILFQLAGISIPAAAQSHLSLEQVLQRFQQSNAALLAGQTNVENTRANEITDRVGSYLSAVNQLNLAVGREVLQ